MLKALKKDTALILFVRVCMYVCVAFCTFFKYVAILDKIDTCSAHFFSRRNNTYLLLQTVYFTASNLNSTRSTVAWVCFAPVRPTLITYKSHKLSFSSGCNMFFLIVCLFTYYIIKLKKIINKSFCSLSGLYQVFVVHIHI